MATKDFRASQIETSKIIGTGSVSAGSTVGIVMYSGSIATNREGGTSDSAMLNNVGTDVFLFVSGTISSNNFESLARNCQERYLGVRLRSSAFRTLQNRHCRFTFTPFR